MRAMRTRARTVPQTPLTWGVIMFLLGTVCDLAIAISAPKRWVVSAHESPVPAWWTHCCRCRSYSLALCPSVPQVGIRKLKGGKLEDTRELKKAN